MSLKMTNTFTLSGSKGWGLLAAATLLTSTASANVNNNTSDDVDRLADLESKVEVLTEEIQRLQNSGLEGSLGESHSGLGAAASKVFDSDSGLSIGGYGEATYTNFRSGGADRTDRADFLRAILYVGYKFDKNWVLNTEIEIEHADEIFLEFGALDYLHSDELNLRAGLLLLPMGFVNELHEPNTFHSVRRSDVESFIIPSTWRENGVGAYGTVGDFDYRTYVVNGFDGQKFEASNGLRSGRQKGSKAKADDFAGVVRIDWKGVPDLIVGGSYYVGHSAQDVEGINGKVEIMEAHVEWKHGGFYTRGLWASADVSDVAALAAAREAAKSTPGLLTDPAVQDSVIGGNLQGGYIEAGFDVFTLTNRVGSLTPFVRLESYDLQRDPVAGFFVSGQNDVRVATMGCSWQPNANLIFKADWQNYDARTHDAPNQFNLSMGYIF
ncbi:MAG: hypothetical protein ACI8TQ_002543 [Planctomycetota bacterium]|jgi:hypothetical protein